MLSKEEKHLLKKAIIRGLVLILIITSTIVFLKTAKIHCVTYGNNETKECFNSLEERNIRYRELLLLNQTNSSSTSDPSSDEFVPFS